MSVPLKNSPTLEDLRQSGAPAWLWDGARARIVWANAAGIAAFEGRSLFDLVDRLFDAREPGVARVQELCHMLPAGGRENALLHFPSAGLTVPLDCICYLHALADGRSGLLVVVRDKPVQKLGMPPQALAHEVLAKLPFAIATMAGDGIFKHCNEAALSLLDVAATPSLSTLINSAARAEELLSRASVAGLASSVETAQCLLGTCDLKLVLSKTASADVITLLIEDVTTRRALENQLNAPLVRDESKPPIQQANVEAFATLAKSLEATLRQQTAQLERKVELVAASEPAPEKRKVPFVPETVRQSLENTTEAILIRREGAPLFATSHALALTGHVDVTALLNDDGLWAALDVVQSGASAQISYQNKILQTSRASIPWQNGPAEQFVLRAIAKEKVAASVIIAAGVSRAPQAETVVPLQPTSVVADAAPAFKPDVSSASANAELRAILDVASDGIVTLDGEGRILSFSAGAESIFGRNSSAVVELPLADLLNPDSRKTLRDYLSGLSGPGLASVFNDGREVTATTPQGDSVPLFFTVGKLQAQNSRAAFCVVIRDITPWKRTEKDLREAKEQAEAASRQKSDFLARISHELRTPLNAIMGFSEVMRTERFGELKNEKYRGYANDIHSSGAHLLALINDLLDLSKVEAGKLELNFTAVSVEEAAEHAMHMLQDQATLARVIVRKSFPPHLPRIVADHRSVRQVMLNLVSNSIKYTNTGGQVIISAAVDKSGELTLRIKDSGIGMTPSQLEDALQPFTRVETADRERQGTGLGLPLTKALVEANRARFNLSSEPGTGTLAEITFPGTRVLAE